MLHLAIECSALGGSVALLRQKSVVAELMLPADVGSVQTMAPAIARLLTKHSPTPWPARRPENHCAPTMNDLGSEGHLGAWPPVGFVSVTHGPGSFTGLRAGLATAKMLGLAWRIPLVAVDTLQVIAASAALEAQKQAGTAVVVAVQNAFRKQVFASAWRLPADSPPDPGLDLIPLAPTQVLDAAKWQEQPLLSLMDNSSAILAMSTVPVCVSGPGLRTYLPTTSSPLVSNQSQVFASQSLQPSVSDSSVHTLLLTSDLWDPTARWVGLLGWQLYLAGRTVSAAELSPNYNRRSAAEEASEAPYSTRGQSLAGN